MAVQFPLPADLPTDWAPGQTIAPTGEEVGLSQQHGYNYLAQQVNAAQQAANELKENKANMGLPQTWTPTLMAATSPIELTYTRQLGLMYQIGYLVYVSAHVAGSISVLGSGELRVGPLPVVSSIPGYYLTGSMYSANKLSATQDGFFSPINRAENIGFIQTRPNGDRLNLQAQNVALGTFDINVSLVYLTSM